MDYIAPFSISILERSAVVNLRFCESVDPLKALRAIRFYVIPCLNRKDYSITTFFVLKKSFLLGVLVQSICIRMQ